MRPVAAIMAPLLLMGVAGGESKTGWAMCRPESMVTIRKGPGKRYDVLAYRYLGDSIVLDGERYGKWRRCEVDGEKGWVREDFLSMLKPETVINHTYEVARDNVCARISAGGRAWNQLKEGTLLAVYVKTPVWSVTSQGFVRTKDLRERGGMNA